MTNRAVVIKRIARAARYGTVHPYQISPIAFALKSGARALEARRRALITLYIQYIVYQRKSPRGHSTLVLPPQRTPFFRLRQVMHPFDLPGTPTMITARIRMLRCKIARGGGGLGFRITG